MGIQDLRYEQAKSQVNNMEPSEPSGPKYEQMSLAESLWTLERMSKEELVQEVKRVLHRSKWGTVPYDLLQQMFQVLESKHDYACALQKFEALCIANPEN